MLDMGKLLILPPRQTVVIENLPDLTIELTPGAELPLPPPPFPPSPSPVGPGAFPPIGLTDWDRDAGQRIADNLAEIMTIPRRSYEVAVVFSVQAHHEDAGGNTDISEGARFNNPLNLSAPSDTYWRFQNGRYLGRFAKFDNLEHGAEACALNYKNGVGYASVRAAFSADDFLGLASAIQNSPWDETHYGGNLVNEVRNALGLS